MRKHKRGNVSKNWHVYNNLLSSKEKKIRLQKIEKKYTFNA